MKKLQFKFWSILFQHNFIWKVSMYAGSRHLFSLLNVYKICSETIIVHFFMLWNILKCITPLKGWIAKKTKKERNFFTWEYFEDGVWLLNGFLTQSKSVSSSMVHVSSETLCKSARKNYIVEAIPNIAKKLHRLKVKERHTKPTVYVDNIHNQPQLIRVV